MKASSQSDSHAPSKPPSGSSSGSENGSADDGAENPNNFTGADAEQTLKQRMKDLKLTIDPAQQAEGRVPNDEERADLQLQLQDLSNELTKRNILKIARADLWWIRNRSDWLRDGGAAVTSRATTTKAAWTARWKGLARLAPTETDGLAATRGGALE